MKTVNNFCEVNPIRISVSPARNGNPSLVVLSQHGGSMSFHHGMTTVQANELIEALTGAIVEAEGYQALVAMQAKALARYQPTGADIALQKIVAHNAFLAAST